ncbi:MAG TPA: PDZ domain-containing protein [Pyrinomonadaceae bacterium]|jgi:predicted metalloprotease with PDZ domain|nr:PDZ domain-containing protein [Pyrinomonadaceae bacterium]
MLQARTNLLALFASLIFLALAPHAARAQTDERSRTQAPNAPQISYTVSMPKPYTHFLEVEARLRYANGAPNVVALVMPVWTPGSYLVREYERNVEDFNAADASGHALPWSKTNKDTWRVETGGARELRVSYRVYSDELSVRTNEVNDRHAFWNNAATLMYPDGNLGSPSTLHVEPFGGWKIATGLPPVAGERDTFRAENFDILYDSPFLVSDFRVVAFEVKGVPHRVVIDGEGNYDPERMRRDVQKIVEAETTLMGEIPYHDYTFILLLTTSGGGGLEHLNSTSLTYRRFGFSTEGDWRSFDGLVAHEFFHLWNVKRIRPDALGPFDYTQENYTRLLWVAEGITDYYASLTLRRAGLISDRDYLDAEARAFQNVQSTPGRLEQSAEEASFDAWVKEYRPDENTVNSTLSYYSKGAALGLLLDLEIRKRSDGAHSLDDVMRALYRDFYKQGRNYTPEDFQREAEAAAGTSLDEFFTRYVRGHDELDYNSALDAAGLRLDTASGPSGRPAPEEAYLGATFAREGEQVLGRAVPPGALVVRSVLAGTPAYEQGVNAGDEIVAVDGYRATPAFLNSRVADKRPGDTLTLTVFRADELRTFAVKLGAHANVVYRINTVAQPTDRQKRNYQAWLDAPYPSGGGTR